MLLVLSIQMVLMLWWILCIGITLEAACSSALQLATGLNERWQMVKYSAPCWWIRMCLKAEPNNSILCMVRTKCQLLPNHRIKRNNTDHISMFSIVKSGYKGFKGKTLQYSEWNTKCLAGIWGVKHHSRVNCGFNLRSRSKMFFFLYVFFIYFTGLLHCYKIYIPHRATEYVWERIHCFKSSWKICNRYGSASINNCRKINKSFFFINCRF